MVFVNLIDSIPELLYKHNCVIIPGFGGFITNFKHAGFEESRNLISPSCKKVAFNQSLIENDGLLVNTWSQKKGISYKEAMEEVESFRDFLKERIFSHKSFDFKNIGTFYLNTENKIIFVPYQGLNFLESSFGLFPVKIKSIHTVSQAAFEPIHAEAEKVNYEIAEKIETSDYSEEARIIYFKNPLWLKAASIVILCTISAFSLYYIIQNKKGPEVVHEQTLQTEATQQEASLISIDSNTEKEVETRKITLTNLEYTAERQKMSAIRSQLDSFSEYNSPKNETYNVIVGYYLSPVVAQKTLNELQLQYPGASFAERTEAGYSIIVETFYKHTTAKTFSVILQQNGYKNVKIEKQVVFGK